MPKCRLLLLLLPLLALTPQGNAQFAHADHKQIVDAAGKPLQIHAINLGNWLVPEGYMWLLDGGPQSPTEIRALVWELLGPEGSAAFWPKYRENYVTREDIALYQSPQEQQHLFAVWRRLATHYRDDPTVLGYDLLNEPIPHYPHLAFLNPSLEPLYKALSAEIRKVDSHHILFLGGAQWDSNFSVFGKPFDVNVAYTFHKYWTAPDESVLREYIDFRERFAVPIWMGESGENTDQWIAQFVQALEKNNIGWAFWPYKKMEKSSAVVSIIPPADWAKIVAFAKLPRGTGHSEERSKTRPSQETINHAFAELLENVRVQKCRVNDGYLKALGM